MQGTAGFRSSLQGRGRERLRETEIFKYTQEHTRFSLHLCSENSPLGSSETPCLKILLYVAFAIPLLCLAWLCSAH